MKCFLTITLLAVCLSAHSQIDNDCYGANGDEPVTDTSIWNCSCVDSLDIFTGKCWFTKVVSVSSTGSQLFYVVLDHLNGTQIKKTEYFDKNLSSVSSERNLLARSSIAWDKNGNITNYECYDPIKDLWVMYINGETIFRTMDEMKELYGWE